MGLAIHYDKNDKKPKAYLNITMDMKVMRGHPVTAKTVNFN